MRELVLNHASMASPNLQACLDWLKAIAVGASILTSRKVVGTSLRASLPLEEIQCTPGLTLWNSILELQKSSREEALFLLRLNAKAPLATGLDSATKDRLRLAHEVHPLSPDEGEPLLLCAIKNWIAVSFPSAGTWKEDTILVEYSDLLPNGTWKNTEARIDNLACIAHSESICARHASYLRTHIRSLDEMWMQRNAIFPHLIFGMDVEHHLRAQSTPVSTTIQRLSRLDSDAAAWKSGPAPSWSLDVSSESAKTMSNPRLRSRREFRAHDGTRKIFEWHAKFDGTRIHFALNHSSHTIEIGYIGPHLPI